MSEQGAVGVDPGNRGLQEGPRNMESGAGEANGMHHRARRLFGRNGPRHSTHVPGDALQTVEESLTMQYLNTQRQKEALMLAESADFVSYHGSKDAPSLRAVSPWHTPKDPNLTAGDSESGSNATRPSWANRADGDKSDVEGQTTSGSFSSTGSAGKQGGSFMLNSRESSGTQQEVFGASEDQESSKHGKFRRKKKPMPKNSKFAAMLYKEEPASPSQKEKTAEFKPPSSKTSTKSISKPVSQPSKAVSMPVAVVDKPTIELNVENDDDNVSAVESEPLINESADFRATPGRETPMRRNSGKDLSSSSELIFPDRDGRRDRHGKVWSWKKFGLKKASKKISNPLEEPLEDPEDDPFKERSPLEDAMKLPMDHIPSASEEEEILPDLPSDASLPSSKGGSFRKYAVSEGHSRDSLKSSSRVNSEPQEKFVGGISKLAQARAARMPQSVQYPAPMKDRAVAASILQEIERMRQDAEEAEKKLLAAEQLAKQALGQPGSGSARNFRSLPGVSKGSGQSADGFEGPLRAMTPDLTNVLDEASRSLASIAHGKEDKVSTSTIRNYRLYTWDEIVAATNNFSRQLGEGGFGTVYHGVLNHTPVAVKVMKNTEEIDAAYEFKQEVDVLGELRHPHIMMLLGCCPEMYCLVYEYMANGSLEDRLRCLAGTPPLAWYTRLRVCAEIASALLNLHSRPEPIVHRDLKPANVLLDKNFVAKLGDVGLAKIMPQKGLEEEYLHESKPVGTLAYVDPEFQRTGDFSPKSDVYAFGIVLLDVLTGRNPRVYEMIEDAVEAGNPGQLAPLLDRSAGDWPISVAMEIASLAVRCSEMKRRKRPELEAEVMPILDKIHTYASSVEDEATRGGRAGGGGPRKPPSCLFCPITQEIMEDPMIASDGHTYEAIAIQGWLQGNDRSPITNQKLPNKDLLPNLAIKSMISDWRAQEKSHQ